METLRHLVELSRLSCTSAELEALLPDMEVVLNLMDGIRDFPNSPDEARFPLSLDMLREDKLGFPDDRKDKPEKGAMAGSQVFWTPRVV